MARQKFDEERRGFQIVRVCVRCEEMTFEQESQPLIVQRAIRVRSGFR